MNFPASLAVKWDISLLMCAIKIVCLNLIVLSQGPHWLTEPAS